MTNTKPSPGIGKPCKRCGKTAPDVVFGAHKYKTAQGIPFSKEKGTCKPCEAEIAKEYRANNTERLSQIKETYRDNNHGIKWHVQEKISTWRKASPVESDLTVQYLIDLYYQQCGLCYYTGDNMIIGWVDGKIHSNTLSLDRLEPSKGYVKGNVVWCTYLVNTMKQNMSTDQFVDIIYKLFRKGEKMPNFHSVQQLRQIAAHARVGSLANILAEQVLSAAQQGFNETTLDCHESNTATFKFSDSLGPHYRKLFNRLHHPDSTVTWDQFLDAIVDDLVTVTEYNIVRDTKGHHSVPSIMLFLTIKW